MADNSRVHESDEVDAFDVRASIRSIVDAVRYNGRLILATCAMTLILLTLYIIIWPPVYRANALLMTENDQDFVRDQFYQGWNVFRKDDARTEIELMTARPVLKEVVLREGLTYDDVYHPVLSHIAHLWGKSFVGRNYRKVKRKILPQPADAPSDEEIELARTIMDLRSGIRVDAVTEANVGRVSVKGPSRRVASVANTLVDVYLEQRSARYSDEARRSSDVLLDEIEITGEQVEDIQARRVAFAADNGLTFDLEKENFEVQILTDLETSMAASRSMIAARQASLREVEAQLLAEDATTTTSTVFELNAIRESLKQKRLDLEARLSLMRGRFREDSPEIKDLENDIRGLDGMIADASDKVEKIRTEGVNVVFQELLLKRSNLQTEIEGALGGLEIMEQRAEELRGRLAEVPELLTQLHDLDREYAWAKGKYSQLLTKEAQASVSATTARAAMPSLRLIEYAMTPVKKSWPKPKLLYPLALIMGLFLGVALAVLRTQFDGKVRFAQIANGWDDMPLYGTVEVPEEPPLSIQPGAGRSDEEPRYRG